MTRQRCYYRASLPVEFFTRDPHYPGGARQACQSSATQRRPLSISPPASGSSVWPDRSTESMLRPTLVPLIRDAALAAEQPTCPSLRWPGQSRTLTQSLASPPTWVSHPKRPCLSATVTQSLASPPTCQGRPKTSWSKSNSGPYRPSCFTDIRLGLGGGASWIPQAPARFLALIELAHEQITRTPSSWGGWIRTRNSCFACPREVEEPPAYSWRGSAGDRSGLDCGTSHVERMGRCPKSCYARGSHLCLGSHYHFRLSPS